MAKQIIYSVHQRSHSGALVREMGMFTDDAMADQSIDHLYRYAWSEIIRGTASPLWFAEDELGKIKLKGFDVWAIEDKHSEFPLFFKVPHELWNQVPPSAEAFHFTQEIVDHGTVKVT